MRSKSICLDKETKKALNAISLDFLKHHCPAYEHDIVWYGTEAILHGDIMRKVQQRVKDGFSLRAFLKEYSVKFDYMGRSLNNKSKKIYHERNPEAPLRLCIDLKILEKDRIFVPKHTYEFFLEQPLSVHESHIWLFNRDYINRLQDSASVELMNHSWTKADLLNPLIVQHGFEFAKALWEDSIKKYEKGLEFHASPERPFPRVQPERVNQLARKLINYYTSLFE